MTQIQVLSATLILLEYHAKIKADVAIVNNNNDIIKISIIIQYNYQTLRFVLSWYHYDDFFLCHFSDLSNGFSISNNNCWCKKKQKRKNW